MIVVKRFLLGAMMSALLFSLTGCVRNVRWQEEVQLSSGEVIVIDREVKHAGGGAAWPQGQGSIPREHIIRFRFPAHGDRLIEWHSTRLDDSSYAELPLALDVDADKTWTIFTRLPLGGACSQYLKYAFKNGVWVEVRLPDEIGVHRTNLFLAADSNHISGLIGIAEKTKENADPGYPRALRQVGPNRFWCMGGYAGPYPPKDAIY
jgi:hypothetical protein